MKHICLGYADEKRWEAMSESERNASAINDTAGRGEIRWRSS